MENITPHFHRKSFSRQHTTQKLIQLTTLILVCLFILIPPQVAESHYALQHDAPKREIVKHPDAPIHQLVQAEKRQAQANVSANNLQTDLPGWSTPINLSQSGAASQPRLVSGSGETLQAFWIDRFDGLMSAYYDGEIWSQGAPTPIPGRPPDMPLLVADRSGWVHAFWRVQLSQTSQQDSLYLSLYTSKMPVGGTEWSPAELLAEDAIDFSIFAPVSGGLDLAYIRRLNESFAPAGIYIRQLESGRSTWSVSTNIYASIYYRLLTSGSAFTSISNDGQGNLHVIWQDPFEAAPFLSQSNDNGITWSTPAPFGEVEIEPGSFRQAAIPGTMTTLWRSPNVGNCLLFQKTWDSGSDLSGGPASGETQATPGAIPLAPSVISPEAVQIFPNLENCPVGDSLWLEENQKRIIWLWGEGGSNLTLTAWDQAQGKWSLPVVSSFSFQNPEVLEAEAGLLVLSDLHATIDAPQMAVVGSDNNGEIWVTQANQTIDDLVFAPQSDWGTTLPVTDGEQSAMQVDLAMDEQGNAHLVWLEPSQTNRSGASPESNQTLGASLLYSRWNPASSANDQLMNNQVVIISGVAGEIVRHPDLIVDPPSGLLHLAWSGASQGDILYSRVPIDRAGTASEWFTAQNLSTTAYAIHPQLGIDNSPTASGSNTIYLIYAVPINEERGIYLTQSNDRGQTWSIPERIFDASAAGMQSIDHPVLEVSPEGNLHIAWVETSPAGNGITQAIFYFSSSDQGETWSKPIVIAGPGHDWPKLALTGETLHIVYAQHTATGGLLWHRERDLAPPPAPISPDEQGGWSPAERLPGWGEVSLPFGLTADQASQAPSLYLVGSNPVDGLLNASSWKEGTWSAVENFSSGGFKAPGNGLWAETPPQGGTLAISWLLRTNSRTQNQSSLFFTSRSIPEVAVALRATPEAESTPTILPTTIPTLSIPTPTPNLNALPPPSNSAQMPLIIGGAFAALLVGVYFILRVLLKRR